MVQFRSADREIQFKIVYYGPALGGKTTTLEAIHDITDPEDQTQITSLKTAEDRTLFFDFLPFDIGAIQGYGIRLQIYTVPGQVQYNTTRKVVLAGADGIVFVADSSPGKLEENFTAWENMKANLIANKMKFEEIPSVIQLNKRDLPDAAAADDILNSMRLSRGSVAVFESVALTGQGVLAAFEKVVQGAVSTFSDKFKLTQKGIKPETLFDGIHKVFQPFEGRLRKAPVQRPESQIPDKGLSEEDQLIAALESTTQLAEQYQETERLSRMYQQRLQEMTSLYEMGTAITPQTEISEVFQQIERTLQTSRPAWIASLFTTSNGDIKPFSCTGMKQDPLWESARASLLEFIKTKAFTRLSGLGSLIKDEKVASRLKQGEAYIMPLGVQGAPLAHLVLYRLDKAMTAEDERFMALLERYVSPRLQAILFRNELAETNERLEMRVVERTAELTAALERLKELDQLKRAFLNSVSHEMKTPLTNIRSYADLLLRYPQQREKKAKDYLEVIIDQSQKLESLITDMLSFSKVKEPSRGVSCNLGDVLDELVEAYKPRIEAKHLQLELQKDTGALTVTMNLEDAEVLFKQILDNGVKFSPEGVRLRVYLLEDARKVTFAVRDFGRGFPRDQKERLMEADSSHPTSVPSFKDSNLGLGLFLVREVLSKYGGGIHIEDMEPGTNVVVELPKSMEGQSSKEAAGAG
jgi:signal transduction histidine kinase/signal recognition particle receptor subunit beta